MGFLLLAGLFLAGCNQQSQLSEGYFDKNHDKNGRAFVNTGDAGVHDEYTMDSPMSEQNPNFINFDGNRVNNQSFVDKARQVISETQEFEPGSVWMNGHHMWVTAYKKGQLTNQEKVEAEARLHKILTKAIPRYDIEVRVQEDRT